MSEPVESSGSKTATGMILAAECRLRAVQLITDGTNAGTIEIWDSDTATTSGKKLLAKYKATGASFGGSPWIPESGIDAKFGLYAVLTLGAGAAEFVVHYSR
jgi:hypothetical protein